MKTDLTIDWDDDESCIVFIDQTLLPGECRIVRCRDTDRLATAVMRLEIRGAPALGVAGAYGVALAAVTSRQDDLADLLQEVASVAESMKKTRPTAVNLAWGIDRVMKKIRGAQDAGDVRRIALAEAKAIAAEDVETCLAIGRHGAGLLPDRCTVLTHCNAGALACTAWGTALGVIRSAAGMGKEVRVVACETRPLHQGSRLTAWELSRDGVDVTVITDSSAASMMRNGEIDLVITGADRITRDAVFNKIGTYMHAVCAHHHAIPFYVAAPFSTFDLSEEERDVVVEMRGRDEIAFCGGRQLVPDDVVVRNPAFDATPLSLVTAVITEEGVLSPPFTHHTLPSG